MSRLYSVIDIETTGGNTKNEKIIEIAIVVTDGSNIINKFSSLVNPEKRVLPFISSLTGITNEMLEDAPKFYEIAADIVNITKNTIFVAHNVNFDYSFIKQEFLSLGYNFSLNNICTVKLSRELIKGMKSYSLGNLCKDLNISINGRHRALGDALATCELFHLLYKIDSSDYNGENITGYPLRGLNPKLNLSKIDELPHSCGVYYFYDDNNDLIYIGKSKDIRSRILTHLRSEKTAKQINLRSAIADISYEKVHFELVALLKESYEIKLNKPVFNKSQRRNIYNWGIYSRYDSNGYINFEISKTETAINNCINAFSSKKSATSALFDICKEYNLCQKLCGLYHCAGACFNYGLEECLGACCGKESVSEYNKRANKVISKYSLMHQNSLIVYENRNEEIISAVAIFNGSYSGYVTINSDSSISLDELISGIKKYPDNKDAKQIINNYLKTKKDYKIIRLDDYDKR